MVTKRKNPAAVALGRRGGSANTPAQRAQRQAAAQFAGRPRRVCVDCGQPVVGGHQDRRLDETCGPVRHGWRWQQGSAPANGNGAGGVSAVGDGRALDALCGFLEAVGDDGLIPWHAVADYVRASGRTLADRPVPAPATPKARTRR